MKNTITEKLATFGKRLGAAADKAIQAGLTEMSADVDKKARHATASIVSATIMIPILECAEELGQTNGVEEVCRRIEAAISEFEVAVDKQIKGAPLVAAN